MAGKIVQAIIVPEGGNIEALKEVLGEDFSKIQNAEVSKDGGSTVYTLAQKSEFATLSKPVPFGGTNIEAVFGEHKGIKADAIVMPLQQAAATITEEYDVTYSELLGRGFYNTEDIIWSAFRVPFSSPEQRSQVVIGAWDAFRATLQTILAQTANTTISGKAEHRIPPAYGMTELATKLVAEMKKSEKRLLQKLGEAETDTENPDHASGKTEEIDMKAEEIAAMLKEAVAPIQEQVTALSAKFEAFEKPEVKESPVPEMTPVVDATKSEGLTAEAVTNAVNAALAPVTEELAALKQSVTETAEKTEALQHAGRGHIDVEALAKKHEGDPRLKSETNKFFIKQFGKI